MQKDKIKVHISGDGVASINSTELVKLDKVKLQIKAMRKLKTILEAKQWIETKYL